MKRISVLAFLALVFTYFAAASGQRAFAPPPGSCEEVTFKLKLPASPGKKKSPVTRLKWEEVDKVITEVRESLAGRDCQFTFGQLFTVTQKKDQVVYFPLTNNVLSTVPDATFQGLQVFDAEGKGLGAFEGRVPHERSGGNYAKKRYTLFSFQYKNSEGEFQSVGGRLLLDEYLVKWEDIKDKVAVTTR